MKPQTLPLIFYLMVSAGCSGNSPKPGVTDGRLRPCPNTPNCVNSQAADKRHGIAPIAYEGERQQARKHLLNILQQMPRTEIVVSEPDYIRATFRSLIFRFVDDGEFYFPDESLIHVRSASRLGYSDLGVNRRRIETIRQALTAQGPF